MDLPIESWSWVTVMVAAVVVPTLYLRINPWGRVLSRHMHEQLHVYRWKRKGHSTQFVCLIMSLFTSGNRGLSYIMWRDGVRGIWICSFSDDKRWRVKIYIYIPMCVNNKCCCGRTEFRRQRCCWLNALVMSRIQWACTLVEIAWAQWRSRGDVGGTTESKDKNSKAQQQYVC